MVTDLHAWQVLKVLTTVLVRFKMGIALAEDFELLGGQLDDYYVAKAQSFFKRCHTLDTNAEEHG